MRKNHGFEARCKARLADKYRFYMVPRHGALATTFIVMQGDTKIAKFYDENHAKQFVEMANHGMSVEV